jgi:hypothetical protein
MIRAIAAGTSSGTHTRSRQPESPHCVAVLAATPWRGPGIAEPTQWHMDCVPETP